MTFDSLVEVLTGYKDHFGDDVSVFISINHRKYSHLPKPELFYSVQYVNGNKQKLKISLNNPDGLIRAVQRYVQNKSN